MLKESSIIQGLRDSFTSLPDGVLGIGDDAAVLPADNGESYVITKDILSEGRHFRLGYFDPESLAHKSLHVNLSDIAAMGACPLFALLGIAIPPATGEGWVRRFSEHFAGMCKTQGVHLIGGDTSASDHDVFISVTAIGRAPTAHLKFRHGAKPGDSVCVVGSLGESRAGFAALEKGVQGFEPLTARTLRPVALVREGLWLGARPEVTAMMDVSDGLHIDLSRMMEASRTGARVDLETLRPSKILEDSCARLGLDPEECILTGGEDYALVLTIAADSCAAIARDFETAFGYPFARIGCVTEAKGIGLFRNGNSVPFSYRPFSHFGEL